VSGGNRGTASLSVAVLITILFWGSAFVGIRAALPAYSPAHLALLRFLSASAALAVYAAITRMRMPALKDLPLIFLLGLLGFAFYNIALNYGEKTIQAGPAALLLQTLPIWTALLARFFLKERLRPLGWVGIGIGFAGALVIAFGKGFGASPGWAAGLILLASITASVYNILQKGMLKRFRPVEVTTWAIWAGTALLLPFSGGLIGEIRAAPAASTAAAVYLGVGPAALAYATWAVVLSRLPASRAAGFLYAVPVTAFVIGWLWLGEVPGPADVIGGLLALAGVAVINTFGRERAKDAGAARR
jgi:drug/metabolite transporter (DMT)-like permease